jgi:hypothetical protein
MFSSEMINVHTKSNKIDSTYNSIANACIVLHTERGLANATGLLVVDAVLLLTMLIGLLRHPHKSSTIWKFLYQQVALVRVPRSAWDADFLLVYNLDSVGHDCRNTPCGLSHFCRLMTFNSLALRSSLF